MTQDACTEVSGVPLYAGVAGLVSIVNILMLHSAYAPRVSSRG